MRVYIASILLAVAIGLTDCRNKESSGDQNSQSSPKPSAQGKAEETEKDMQAVLQSKLAQAGVKIRWQDDGSVLVLEGFPYQKDLSGDYNIKIIKVEKGLFTASESSTVPTAMMGMVYSVAGGSFIAQCSAKEGTQTLADAVGNIWVFAEPGMSFNVYLPGTKKLAYGLRSKVRDAMITFTKEGILIQGFEFILSPGSSEPEQKAKRNELSDKRHVDPKGYFRVVPPAGWRVQEYDDDVRGKVAFFAPDLNIDLRILVNAVDFYTIDELMEFCRSTEKSLGVTMKIEQFDFYGHQAVRRSFEIQGKRFLYVDFLIGKVDHNLAYSAPLDKYNQYLPVVLKSMETYEPILREIGGKENLDHLVAKKLRLGLLMLEIDRVDLALEYVREGLAIAPENQELLNLKQQIDSQFKKPDEQLPVVGSKRFESKKFGFSFNVPPKVNVYTGDNPGPMAARIKADTPMWIVNSDIPTERINVKVTEGERPTTIEILKMFEGDPQADAIPYYEKVSVTEIRIGENQDKAAIEHLHLLKLNPPKKLRQILFTHNGNVFGFTCSTSVDRFDAANKEFFDVVFKSLDFK